MGFVVMRSIEQPVTATSESFAASSGGCRGANGRDPSAGCGRWRGAWTFRDGRPSLRTLFTPGHCRAECL